MTNKELREIAVRLSGRPPHKNKQGIGAYRWLADEIGVHPSTMARWLRGKGNTGSEIPDWAIEHIERLEEKYRCNETVDSSGS